MGSLHMTLQTFFLGALELAELAREGGVCQFMVSECTFRFANFSAFPADVNMCIHMGHGLLGIRRQDTTNAADQRIRLCVRPQVLLKSVRAGRAVITMLATEGFHTRMSHQVTLHVMIPDGGVAAK